MLAMADMALNEGLPDAETLTSWSRRVAKLIRADVATGERPFENIAEPID